MLLERACEQRALARQAEGEREKVELLRFRLPAISPALDTIKGQVIIPHAL